MTITTLPSISDKSDNSTRLTSSEFNEMLDATVQGTKPIYTQGVQLKEVAYSSSGAIAIGRFANMDSSGGALAMTLANPGATGILQVITLGTAGNDAVVTTATAGGFDGTNNTMTFDTAAQTLVLISISSTRWAIIQNVGSVTASTV